MPDRILDGYSGPTNPHGPRFGGSSAPDSRERTYMLRLIGSMNWTLNTLQRQRVDICAS